MFYHITHKVLKVIYVNCSTSLLLVRFHCSNILYIFFVVILNVFNFFTLFVFCIISYSSKTVIILIYELISWNMTFTILLQVLQTVCSFFETILIETVCQNPATCVWPQHSFGPNLRVLKYYSLFLVLCTFHPRTVNTNFYSGEVNYK